MSDIDKVKLYGGIGYWSKVLITLDKKLETICQNYGYGEISFKMVIHNGKIAYSLFSDEIRIKETEKDEIR